MAQIFQPTETNGNFYKLPPEDHVNATPQPTVIFKKSYSIVEHVNK